MLAAGAGPIPATRAPAAGAAPPAAVRQAGKLALHQPVERELGPGQTDVFTVDIAAGQFVHVVVEKKGVDAVLVLADEQGKPLVTADSPNGAFGLEPASLIPERGGEYQIQVAKAPRSSENGRYRNAIELLPPADCFFKRDLGCDTAHFLAPDAELGSRTVSVLRPPTTLWPRWCAPATRRAFAFSWTL